MASDTPPKVRRFRKLRIAWSVFCGVIALLLIALWVRSYWWEDVITAPGDGSWRFGSAKGWMTIRWMEPRWKEMRRMPNFKFKKWQVVSLSVEEEEQKLARTQVKSRPAQFGFVDAGAVQFPYSLPAMVCVGMSVTPWIRWRFSLRALLIATTLLCVLLGVVAWLSR